jgi:hypothetical protein
MRKADVIALIEASAYQEIRREFAKSWGGRLLWAILRFRYWLQLEFCSPKCRKLWKGYSWWTRVKYRHPMIFITYYAFRNRFTPTKCGDYYCHWEYPYGFVPEADCPVHDR